MRLLCLNSNDRRCYACNAISNGHLAFITVHRNHRVLHQFQTGTKGNLVVLVANNDILQKLLKKSEHAYLYLKNIFKQKLVGTV